MAVTLRAMNAITGPSILSLKGIHPAVTQVRTLVDLPIIWNRPTKVPWYEKSQTGDGVLKLEVDMTKSPILADKSEELKTANEEVKLLFTFHFLGRKYAMKRAQQEMIASVRNHNYDTGSPEARVAQDTAVVRNLMEHFHLYPLDRKTRMYLKEKVETRNRRLNELRRFDYKKFEWLLDKLDLYYKPRPEIMDKVERKKSIRYLTERYCNEYKERKLQEYKDHLESKKLDFFQDKIKTLEWIKKEEFECGATPTVTDNDIEKAKQQLETYIKSQEKVEKKKSTNILMDM